MPASILDLPSEILQNVVRFSVSFFPLGPPTELYSLLLTCRTLNQILSKKTALDLYRFIFCLKFDYRAPLSRVGQDDFLGHSAYELKRRFSALAIFQQRDIYHPQLTEALWIAYLMTEESDTRQTNVKQLLRAGLPAFLDTYLRCCLYDESQDAGGWPLLSERNSLALAICWSLTSQSSITREDQELQKEMMTLLRPFVFGSFRYPTFHWPEEVFQIDAMHNSLPAWLSSTHRLPQLPPVDINYFGNIRREARIPSATIFASLLYFTRLESRVHKVPPHITCKTRAEANASGRGGPCLEDVQRFLQRCRTHFADYPSIDTGIRSAALMDTTLCQPTAYKLGTFAGQWQGSYVMPNFSTYTDWVMSNNPHVQFEHEVRRPLFITLEEHYCYSGATTVPVDHLENGIANAWLPSDIRVDHTKDGITFTNPSHSFRAYYDTYRHGQRLPGDQREVKDVIVTGKIDEELSAAWGFGPRVLFLGRIRLVDGLLTLLKTSSLDIGDQLLKGYVTSSQNFVGKISAKTTGEKPASWEGVFSLCRNFSERHPEESFM